MNSQNKIYVFSVLVIFSIACSRAPHTEFSLESNLLLDYLPVNPKAVYVYQVFLDDQSHERTLRWKKGGENESPHVFIFTDGGDFTKVYEFSADSIDLRGISLFEEERPQFYQGTNPCLKLPLKAGNHWTIDATLKTSTTTIHQTGWGRIVRLEKIEVQAGIFDAIKVLYNISSEYRVKDTDERSIVLAQFAIWYGKGVGMVLQEGAAFIEKENRAVKLKQELVKREIDDKASW